MGENAANLSQESLSLTPFTLTLYPKQSVLGVSYFSALQFKERKEETLFSEKADSQCECHSPKALCTPAVLLLVHLMIAQSYMVSDFLTMTLSENMEPNFCPWQITKPPQKSMKLKMRPAFKILPIIFY